ncbi:HAD-IIIA family hydrolase [Bermanella marisrubri]|uniref:Predicted phosphatase n=1 Tax=Bermanella marisrubri TaxID=207949 RepID=Q1N5D9_9GAMM|nr:HAD-IIIA family hydrolase [Bermanella marisrubri]EAT13112.1 predicted phosphatase [Oceanobacter sp. RED65] [Bermanella marisrubri]QIZ83890.1 HAD-IIIA family hydrolase [Bermanella marisrubri]
MIENKHYDAVLFDLDGTLVDTAPDFFVVINEMRMADGLDALSYESVRSVVSNGARALINLAYDIDEGHPEYARQRQRLLDLYLQNVAQETRLFPGFDAMLLHFKEQGIPAAIVTNKPRLYADALLKQLKINHGVLEDYIDSLVCPDDVTHRKPNPEALLLACKEMSVNASNCIYVGDHLRDIQAGKAASMTTLACEFGYVGSPQEAKSWQADQTFATSEALAQHLISVTMRRERQ